MLNVSRQSVSRWEMDAAFPGQRRELTVSVHDCYRFIRESTCFFLATSVKDRPNLRPMGMIYCDHENLFIATDRRKKLKDDVQRDMYRDALPKQYQMLSEAGCIIIPLYRQHEELLKPKDRTALNAYASIWLCIENIFLAATAEGYACSMRIPLGQEKEHTQSLLHFPDEYEMPCFIGLGRPADNITPYVQKEYNLEERIHKSVW